MKSNIGAIFLLAIFGLLYKPLPSYAENFWSGQRGPYYRNLKYLVLHHTQVSFLDHPIQFDIVNRYHRSKFGLKYRSSLGYDVGYNFFCERDGTLIIARLPGEETCAQLEHNFDSVSICLSGNFDESGICPTPAQWRTLKKFIALWPDLLFVFHRDLADRTCPGTNIIKNDIRVLMGPDWTTHQAKLSKKISMAFVLENSRTRHTHKIRHKTGHGRYDHRHRRHH